MERAKKMFPEEGRSKEEVMERALAAKEKDINFDSGRVFGSMCTSPLEIGRKIHAEFLEANLGNPGLCPGTEGLEKEVLEAVGSLIHAPDGGEYLSVGGATEGNIIALWRAREKTGKRKVVLPESAHFSFEKAASLLDMELDYVPLDEDYLPDLDVLEEKVDGSTAAVVGIAGTTELGLIEPIEEMAKIAGETHFHVDAAFGGFVIPFLNELENKTRSFDFSVKGVDSLVLDPHKMGLSTVPLGLFYGRGKNRVIAESPYLTSEGQKTLRGTRSSASIPAFWATMNMLGKEGYKMIVQECMENTYYLKNRMEEIGFESIVDPVLNIASFHCDEPKRLVKEASENRMNLSRTVNPSGLRFVVMPHVTRGSIDEVVNFLEGIR